MIVIEPPQPPGTSRGNAIRRRELSRFLARAIQSVGLKGSVSVLLTDDAQIRQLNRQYRGKDKATDVLSFPAADFGENASTKLAGDLAVSLETAARQAEAFGHPLEPEVKILLLHGLLHLAGFDHETDSGQMSRQESRLRTEFELPSGLIQRSRGSGRGISRKGKGSLAGSNATSAPSRSLKKASGLKPRRKAAPSGSKPAGRRRTS